MKVEEIDETFSCRVEFDDDRSFERYSSGSWRQWMGGSLEECFSFEPIHELEEAYQEYLKANMKPIHEIEPIEVNGIWYCAVGYDKPDMPEEICQKRLSG